MNYIKEYLFKADWYDEYEDKKLTSYGLVMSNSYAEAMGKIERRLPYASNIEITEFDETDFVWMNKPHYERLKNDDEYMFDQEEEKEKIIKCGQPSNNPKDLWPHPRKESLLKTVYGSDFDDESDYGNDPREYDKPWRY